MRSKFAKRFCSWRIVSISTFTFRLLSLYTASLVLAQTTRGITLLIRKYFIRKYIHLLENISTHFISIILNLSVYCLVPSHTRSIFGTEVDKIQLKIFNFKQFKNNPLFLLVDKNNIRFYPGKDWKF